MAKKDKKSKTVEQKARVAAKQSKKATQKEKKVRSKGGEDSDADVVDLESVLEEYAKQVGKIEREYSPVKLLPRSPSAQQKLKSDR